jgi:hypothetical protein
MLGTGRKFPEISYMISVSELENKSAVEDALVEYVRSMGDVEFPVDETDLRKSHENATSKAIEVFHIRAIGDQKQSFLEQLMVTHIRYPIPTFRKNCMMSLRN